MTEARNFTRRSFIKTAAAASAPLIVPASVLGRPAAGGKSRPAPSNRITMGCIGLGGMGTGDMQGFLGHPDAQVVAVCDVDKGHRENAAKIVEEKYASEKASGTFRGCDQYNDFRDVLARKDIDTVLIATPDHWHVLIAIAAAKAGKDMYCEKPLSLTINQGKALVAAIRRYGRVFQTGSQLRSTPGVPRACELVRNGRIGRLHTILTGTTGGPVTGVQPEMPIPAGFDYDFWLGPAPLAPYTEQRCHWNYRWISDYSGGKITDLGAHDNDIAQWGNGTEHTGPVEISAKATFPRDGLWNTAITYRVEYTYANGVKLICSDDARGGCTFIGTEGWIHTRGSIETDRPAILDSQIGPGGIHFPKCRDHAQNFLDCVRSRLDPVAPVDQAHRSITVCHLGVIAMKLGRKLQWNPDAECFVNDPEADAMMSRAMRAPWALD